MMHVAIIIDVCSQPIVGMGLSNTPDAELCLNTLAETCSLYGCPAVFHSDKGSQYKSRIFRDKRRWRGIKQSMTSSRCWKDNVFAERVIWGIKNECIRVWELEYVTY